MHASSHILNLYVFMLKYVRMFKEYISVATAKPGAPPPQSALASTNKPANALKKNVSVKEDGKSLMNGR